MQSSLKKSLQDTPLVSKVALESKKLETLRLKYPSCRIRFRLSTNLAVDATFSSEEPLQNLDQFVREWLRPPLSEASYTLSIGSALIEPMASTSLLVAGLAPSSILIVTFNPRVLEFSHLAPFETNVSTDENTASDMKNMRTEDTGTKDDKNKKNGGLMKKIFKKPGWLKI